MADAARKLPSATESGEVQAPTEWRPLANLRREIDRLFDDLPLGAGRGLQKNTPFDVEPF